MVLLVWATILLVIIALGAIIYYLTRTYLVVWLDKLFVKASDSPGFTNSNSARTIPPATAAKHKLTCAGCGIGKLLVKGNSATCIWCNAEFAIDDLMRNSNQPTAKTAYKQPSGRRVVEITLGGVSIGWLELFQVNFFGNKKHLPINAYIHPDPISLPEDSRFIGRFDNADKAHRAIEKEFLKEQARRKKRSYTKSSRKPL
jgi:hypothetical protein